MKLTIGQTIGAFTVRAFHEVPLRNMSVWQLTHQSGATVFYSNRDDGQLLFAAGFMTLPQDNTGVFHILEHSCLDGSDAYPLKEPFVNLLKTSMYTDLNAGTWQDMTVYHLGTVNEKDYRNMMSVYLDAVFHPAFLHDRRVFEKEAWRLEPDGEGGIRQNGVVLNEMQAAENDRDTLLWLGIYRHLLPDTPYAFSAGGASEDIPQLTYERFCDTYHRFYRPDNCVLFLAGEMDLPAHLSYIDGVLSGIVCSDCPPPAKPEPQAPVHSEGIRIPFCLPQGESEENNSTLALAFALPDERDGLTPFALQTLQEYLAGSLESPLTRAVLDAGIGQDFDMTVDMDALQPIVVCSVKKSDPDRADAFTQTVLQTLERVAAEGIPAERMEHLLRAWERATRESALEPRYIMSVAFGILRRYLRYGEYAPQNNLIRVREAASADGQYWAGVLRSALIENPHRVLICAVPSATMAAERAQALTQTCSRIRAGMTDAAYAELCAHARAFQTYLDTPDSPEALATLPGLHLSDLRTECKHPSVLAGRASIGTGENTVPFLSVTTDTGELCRISLSFDLCDLTEEQLRGVFRLRLALPALGTSRYTPEELRAKQQELCCEINLYHTVRAIRADKSRAALVLNIACTAANIPQVLTLAGEMLRETVYDKTNLYRIYSGDLAGRKNHMITAGHLTALSLAAASLCDMGAYQNALDGSVTNIRRMEEMLRFYDRESEQLAEALRACAQRVFVTARLTVLVSASEQGVACCRESLPLLGLSVGAKGTDCRPARIAQENRALCIPTDVGYCVQMGMLDEIGRAYDPIDSLITQWLSTTCFWDEIRAKGGAYGGGIFDTEDGRLAMWSYRDPHVGETYTRFAGVADWIDAHIPDKEELTALIIKTAADYNKPMSEFGRADRAFYDYLRERDPEQDNRDIARLLTTEPRHFSAFADMLRRLQPYTVRTALAREDLLRGSGLFDTVENL